MQESQFWTLLSQDLIECAKYVVPTCSEVCNYGIIIVFTSTKKSASFVLDFRDLDTGIIPFMCSLVLENKTTYHNGDLMNPEDYNKVVNILDKHFVEPI